MLMEISTKRLTLSPIRRQSVPALAELLTDPQVKASYMVPELASLADALAMAGRIAQSSQDPQRILFGIHLEGRLIGILNETERLEDSVELGYALLPRFWGQGYCTEALESSIDYLFRQGFRTVIAGAFEENAASIRVMEKCGMTRQPRQDSIEYRGRLHRCVYYSIQKP